MSLARSLLAPALAATLLSLCSTAALAAPSPKEKAEARQLVTDARQAMKEKRFADAIGAFKNAGILDPSPAAELELAQAQVAGGKLVDASRVLGALAQGSDPAPAARKVREAAAKQLAELKARIPAVKVTVKGVQGSASVTVDGLEVDATGEAAVDPGDHTLAATAEGYLPAEKQLKLAEGEHGSVELTLQPKVAVTKAEAAGGSRLPGILVTSVGGASLVVAGIFGGMAFSATSAAKATCTPSGATTTCDPDKVSKAKLFGNVSTGMFVVGGAAAVAGVVLIILAPGGARKEEAPRSGRLVPWVGADQVGVAGSF
jgi:hypothetical protein